MMRGLTAIHVTLTGAVAILALILIAPGDTLGGSKNWALFAALGTDATWAVIFWMVACIGMVGVCTASPWVRLVSVLVLATAHGSIAGLKFMADPAGSGTAPYGGLACLGYYLAWRRTNEGA